LNVAPGLASPRRRSLAAATAAVALALAAAACGGAAAPSTTTPTISIATSTTAPPGGSTAPSTTSPATSTTSSGGCSLGVIEQISGESASEDEQRTESWVTLGVNNWTVFVPNGSWHLSASTAAGADVVSPDGLSDASLSEGGGLSPSTYQALAQQLLSGVSNLQVICQSPNEQSAAGETQATEATGVYNGEAIHLVYALTIQAETPSGFFGAVTRSIYAPISQWSTSVEQALWLIIKRAVFVPSAP